MIKIFSVVRTSLSILRVKAGSLQQLLKSSPVDFLLNSTEISAKCVHFVIVIFLEDTSLNFSERPLTEEQFMNNRASWDGGIVPHPRPRRLPVVSQTQDSATLFSTGATRHINSHKTCSSKNVI